MKLKESTLETISGKYPNLPRETIETAFLWWKPKLKQFHAPYEGDQVKCDSVVLSHSDIYDRLSHYGQKPPDETTAQQWKKHNHQLFDLLRNEFGWKENDDRFYPDPDHLFD